MLNETLVYEVYDIEIVDPDNVNSLRAVQNQDIITLVTCTPYGINTQRLLVHARRTEDLNSSNNINNNEIQNNFNVQNVIILILIIFILIFILICIKMNISTKIKKKGKHFSKNE